MDDHNESTHDRLNRELARLKFRDLSFWGGWALMLSLFALLGFLYLNVPRETRYVTGIAGQSMSMPTESRMVIQTRVFVEGITYDLRLPSQLVHPAEGDVLCLRAGKARFTGHTTYVNVSMTLCQDTEATPDVD